MSDMRYHSAMCRYGGIAKSTDEIDPKVYTDGRITCFQHDICSEDIPKEFYKADCIYSVMAWRSGYNHFTEHTIAKNTTFNEYCAGMSRVINALNKPTFIISNRNFLKRLNPHRVEPILFDKFKTDDVVAIWNYDGSIPSDTISLMKQIGNTYDLVLDFCCGYGEVSGYVKKCILSDVNTGCLSYIRDTLMSNPH